MLRNILVVDDERNMRRGLRAILEGAGYQVYLAEDGVQAMELYAQDPMDVVVTDVRMPGMDGVELLRRLLTEDHSLPVIVITAHGTIETAVECMKIGAFDYITKPFDRDQILAVIDKALKTSEKRLAEVRHEPDSIDIEGYGKIIGSSPAMRAIYRMLVDVAPTGSTVLITGETGTGKELLARAIHGLAASRRTGPFVGVNCAAINPNLLEAELFGHEKGAFTGAVDSRPGRFELANGGTLFLDEIGEIEPSLQVKLLRAIQERSVERVGGVKTIRLDTRLVCATNKDLKAEVEAGRFREDLFYRINVIPIRVPPLRERPEDIVPVARYLLQKLADRVAKEGVKLSPAAETRLQAYDWPGNVRELENVVEQALVFCKTDTIEPPDLPPQIAGGSAEGEDEEDPGIDRASLGAGELKAAIEREIERVEKRMIREALLQCGSNRTKAAMKLGLSRRGLQYKLKKYRIDG